MSPEIGDVNGDGDEEIVFVLSNESDDDDYGKTVSNDHLIILSKDGSLITDTTLSNQWRNIGLTLAELDTTNPGLEIVTGKYQSLVVLDYLGNELHSDSAGYVAGQIFIVDDIDYDNKIELINIDEEEHVKIRDGMTSSTGNTWATFGHDYSRTGYQD